MICFVKSLSFHLQGDCSHKFEYQNTSRGNPSSTLQQCLCSYHYLARWFWQTIYRGATVIKMKQQIHLWRKNVSKTLTPPPPPRCLRCHYQVIMWLWYIFIPVLIEVLQFLHLHSNAPLEKELIKHPSAVLEKLLPRDHMTLMILYIFIYRRTKFTKFRNRED